MYELEGVANSFWESFFFFGCIRIDDDKNKAATSRHDYGDERRER